MSTSRIDQLLEDALATGVVLASATPSERAEVEALLAVAGSARAIRTAVDGESRDAMATARARFQRYVAAAPPSARPAIAAIPQRGFLGRAFAVHRALTVASSAAAIGIVALVAVVASQSYGGVQSASAQVLNENDYAQLQGVITATSGEGAARTATLSSDFGDVEIGLSELSSVTNADQTVDASTLKTGDAVTVAGTVAKKDKTTVIAARTLHVVKANAKPPEKPKLILLRALARGFEGRITVLAVAKDGRSARALVDGGNGEQFVVIVDAKSLGALLNGTDSAVGRRVTVSQEPGHAKGEFSLASVVTPGQPTAVPRPGMAGVAGVIVGRESNVLRIQTERGPVQVVMTAETRIAIGPDAGLTVDRVRAGNLVLGHAVIVRGGVDRATGRLVADVIWVGANPGK